MKRIFSRDNIVSQKSDKDTDSIRTKNKSNEIDSKSAQNIQVLLKQNWQLEREITRLNRELDEATNGILMRGYLYKYREREISFASKWALRYFLLQGNILSYFLDVEEHRPRRTVDISGCIVRDEGSKKNGQYHVFSISWSTDDIEIDTDNCNIVLRLSTTKRVEALQWIRALDHACKLTDNDESEVGSNTDSTIPNKSWGPLVTDISKETKAYENYINNPNENLSAITLQRVKSSSEILHRSMSRFALSNDDLQAHLEAIRNASVMLSDTSDDMEIKRTPLSPIPDSPIREKKKQYDEEEETTPTGTSTSGSIATTTAAATTNMRVVPESSASSSTKSSKSGNKKNRRKSSIKINLDDQGGVIRNTRKGSIQTNTTTTVKNNTEANSMMTSATGKHSSKSSNKSILKFPASKPIHLIAKSSPLSTENRTSEQNYRGFFNLGVIILVVSNMGLTLENLHSYGFVAQFPSWSSQVYDNPSVCHLYNNILLNYLIPCSIHTAVMQSFISWMISIYLAYIIEKLRFHRYISESITVTLHILLGIVNIVGPIVWVWYSPTNPLLCIIYVFEAVVIWMKLISYAHVNHDLRGIIRFHKLTDKEYSMLSLSSPISFYRNSSSSKPSTPRNSTDRLSASLQALTQTFKDHGTGATPTPSTPTHNSTTTSTTTPPPYHHSNSRTTSSADKDFSLQLPSSSSSTTGFSSNMINTALNPTSPHTMKNDGAIKPYDITAYGIKDLEPPILHYPNNITLMNLLYFCVAPTLCYQLNYPRSLRIRWPYVLTIFFRLFLISSFMIFGIQQYILPNLAQSVQDMKEKNFLKISEIILKLSIPNTYTWLLMFYLFFHLWLNLFAELTRFGDRMFYKDWWNSRTISIYWKNWNLPVHQWMLRHLYYPMVNRGVPKVIATGLVFLFSAALHEVVISVPFRYISMHTFFGMAAQAPLVYITRHIDTIFDNPFLGNVLFWCVFCVIGQPMGIVMVYYDIWKAKVH